jgi:hypothetical protein
VQKFEFSVDERLFLCSAPFFDLQLSSSGLIPGREFLTQYEFNRQPFLFSWKEIDEASDLERLRLVLDVLPVSVILKGDLLYPDH